MASLTWEMPFTMVCVTTPNNIVALFAHCSWSIALLQQPATQG